jgi:tetratricopeptide (TPR) repeat protein
MDFGLAHTDVPHATPHLEEADVSEVPEDETDASWLGTPAYMAPEQHLGLAADARSDQFAFCVSLYEAFYGERPYAGNTLAQLAISVTTGDVRPAPPGSAVPGALRGVLLRGLALEPSDRHPTMEAVLDALRRAAMVRRRRMLIAAAGLFVAVGGVFASGSSPRAPACGGTDRGALGRHADTLRARLGGDDLAWSRIEPIVAEHDRQLAAEREQVCHALRDAPSAELDARMLCFDQRRRDLVAVLESASAPGELVAALHDLPEPQSCTTEHTARTTPGTPRDEALREELATARALKRLGKYAEAERLAVDLVARAAEADDPGLAVEVDLVLGSLQALRGALADAEQTTRRAYFAALELGDDASTASAAIALAELVGAELHRPDEGLGWAAHARAALDREPSTRAEAELATSLGTIHRTRGELNLALAEHERALELRTRELGDDHLLVADVLNNLGTVLTSQGRLEEAAAHFERAIAIRRNQLGDDHPRVARALSGLGAALYRAGNYAEAAKAFTESIEIFERALGPDDVSVARVLNNRADLYGYLGRFDEAIADLRRALAIFRRVRGEDAVETALVLDQLGMALNDQGDYTAAVETHQRALAMLESSLGPEHIEVANVLNNLGNAQDYAGQREQARRSYERSIAIFDALEGPPVAKAGPLSNLGALCDALGDHACAIERSQEALRLREEHLGPDHPETAISLTNVGNLRSDRGEQAQAREMLERALRIFESASGDDAYGVSAIVYALAIIEARDGNWVAAEAHLRRCVEIREAANAAPETIGVARFRWAAALWALGRRVEARDTARAALAIFEEHHLPAWVPDVQAWLRRPTVRQDVFRAR